MVTYTIKLRWGGFLTRRYIKIKAAEIMSFVSKTRSIFDRKAEIDTIEREKFVEIYRRGEGRDISNYTEEGKKAISQGQGFFRIFQNNPTKRRIASSSPSVINELAYRKGEKSGWGLSETKLRAKREDILAYLFNAEASCRSLDVDIERRVLQRINDHHLILYSCKRSGVSNFSPRYSVTRYVWAEVSDGSLILVMLPCGHSYEEEITGRVRMNFKVRACEERFCSEKRKTSECL